MNRTRSLVGATAALAAAVTLAGCGVNTIPTQEEAVKGAWGDVQNNYQRRADLVPNLVATVQGYANQEAGVLVAVTQARASATQVKVDASTITDPATFERYAAAQDQLSGVLGRLMVIQENYPQLKSNENFMALQSQLEGTENRIAVSRRSYNDKAQTYNTTLRSFPQNIWAGTVHRGSKPAQYFGASAGAQTAPTVTFTPPAGASTGPTQAPLPGAAPAASK